MGTAAAWSLAQREIDTVLIEQFRVGHSRGSSHGPTRIFRLSYPHVEYVDMALRALPLWRRLEDAAGERLLFKTGGLDAGPQAQECAEALTATGVKYRWLGETEAAKRFPGISFEDLGGVLYQRDAAVCLADRTVLAQLRLAQEAGVELRQETEVLGIVPSARGVVVQTEPRSVEAGVVIVAAGPWSRWVLEAMGRSLPLTPTLQQVTYFAPGESDGDAEWPTFIEWGRPGSSWYAVPAAGHSPNVKVAEHALSHPVDPRAGPFSPDHEREALNAGYVARRFPGLAPEPLYSETCLYTMTPDEDFILDRVGNLVVAAGFSGHGFKFAPLIGEVLADLALRGSAEIPKERFRLGRRVLAAR